MPKLLFARPPFNATEERQVRRLAGARHAPSDWIRRGRPRPVPASQRERLVATSYPYSNDTRGP